MWRKKDNKKEDWEIEVERILKEGSFNSRFDAFMEKFNQEENDPPEEWQGIFNTLFESLIGELPPFACCILAFRAGQVWEKYYSQVEKQDQGE